ncbi:MAG: hypothetical protein KDB94_05770 [Acidobacteria bacterium]|nr:hypothetical protein [Acidobacteriota bacterium]
MSPETPRLLVAVRPRGAAAALLACALALLAGCAAEPAPLPPDRSRLWGVEGELFDPAGPVTDFSFAGYHFGERPLPEVPVVADVRDFGAVGDGVADDSDAFVAALAATRDGALLVPPGRYRLRQVLRFERSGVVLRGAGPGKSVLYIEPTLCDVLGEGSHGGPCGWSWGGGFLMAEGRFAPGERLAAVVDPARRGARELRVSDPSPFAPGRLVRLVESENETGSLTLHLHAGNPLKGPCKVNRPGNPLVDRLLRVVSVEGDRVLFDRPLRVDVRAEWRPELRSFEPGLEEIGIEHLTVEFPLVPYRGHHKEIGHNAIFLQDVWNSWVRDVEVVNFDNGVHFHFARNTTGAGIVARGRGGHYSLSIRGSHDSLFSDFWLETDSVHDLSNALLGNGNVYAHGRGVEVNFDHHRHAPFDNLYTDIDVGDSWQSRRIWKTSPTASGHVTGARETFWGVGPRILGESLPAWPAMTVVGALEGSPAARAAGGWFEPVADLRPADLYRAQLARRLGTPP